MRLSFAFREIMLSSGDAIEFDVDAGVFRVFRVKTVQCTFLRWLLRIPSRSLFRFGVCTIGVHATWPGFRLLRRSRDHH